MPTFNDPAQDADELRQAVRGLAHATRAVEDPTSIYSVLGAVGSARGSLAQSLRQIGDLHDGPATKRAWVEGDVRSGRAASCQVAWDVHRAAEMVHQVAGVIDRAHEVEATIAYEMRDFPNLAAAPRPIHEPGLSL
jgi:hypothetical protein